VQSAGNSKTHLRLCRPVSEAVHCPCRNEVWSPVFSTE